MTEFDPFSISGRAAEEERKVGRAVGSESPTANVAADQLRSLIERIERLEEEKAETADLIKDVFGEAKSLGFDTKAMKAIIRLRRKDPNERAEEELILDAYLAALGMLPDG
jgi:uncharacterized protein (UPF0335 family)